MKKTITFLSLPLLVATTPAIAQNFGGYVDLGYVLQDKDPDYYAYSNGDDTWDGLNLSGAIGLRSGNFGAQLDIASLGLDFQSNGNDGYDATAAQIHLFYRLGEMDVGAFWGRSSSSDYGFSDLNAHTWFGIEAAGRSGALSYAVQFGQSDLDNDFNLLDHTERNFFTVSGSYDLGSAFEISGGLAHIEGANGSDDAWVRSVWGRASYDIGLNGLQTYVQFEHMSGDYTTNTEEVWSEQNIQVGIRFDFGASGNTPMTGPAALNYYAGAAYELDG